MKLNTSIKSFKTGSRMLEWADLGHVIYVPDYPNVSMLYNRLYSGLRCCGLTQELSAMVVKKFHEDNGRYLVSGSDITYEEVNKYFNNAAPKMVEFMELLNNYTPSRWARFRKSLRGWLIRKLICK